MGRIHTNAYNQVSQFFKTEHVPVKQVVCGRNEEKVEAFAKQWGYADTETDWRELVKRDDIDAIDICTPNDSHHDIALAAIENGKMVLCEKPLALNGEQGEKMVAAVEASGLPNLVWYNYRFAPAVTMAKQKVDSGALGRIFHYRANFLQDWTISQDLPQGGEALWRLDSASAGSGVTGDLLAHNIDCARWLNGDIISVSAMTETFIKERVHNDTGEVHPVTIDDACAFLARFENGSLGIFEATRYARGHKALKTFEINGEHQSLSWDLHDMNRLGFFDHGVKDADSRGWASIHVSEGDHPYMGNWWIPGLGLGGEHPFIHGILEFMKSLDDPTASKAYPDFRHALGTQYVCDAVLESAATKQWVDVKRA